MTRATQCDACGEFTVGREAGHLRPGRAFSEAPEDISDDEYRLTGDDWDTLDLDLCLECYVELVSQVAPEAVSLLPETSDESTDEVDQPGFERFEQSGTTASESADPESTSWGHE